MARSPNPAIPPDALALLEYWLLRPVLALKTASTPTWKGTLVDVQGALLPLLKADDEIKRILSYRTWEGYAGAMVDQLPTKAAPFSPDHPSYVLPVSAILGPALVIQDILLIEEYRTQDKEQIRRFDHSVTRYWNIFRPLLEKYGITSSDTQHLNVQNGYFFNLYKDVKCCFSELQEVTKHADNQRQMQAARKALYKSTKSYTHYLDSLVHQHAALEVLYIGLTYTPMARRHQQPPLDFYGADAHFKQFVQKRRHSPLFKGLKGYIWKRDGNSSYPYLFHFFLFFDPEVFSITPDLKEQICQLWIEQITQGEGACVDLLDGPVTRQRFSPKWLCLPNQKENRTTVLLDRQHASFEPRFQELKRMVHALLQVDRLTYLEFPAGYPRLGRGQLPVSS